MTVVGANGGVGQVLRAVHETATSARDTALVANRLSEPNGIVWQLKLATSKAASIQQALDGIGTLDDAAQHDSVALMRKLLTSATRFTGTAKDTDLQGLAVARTQTIIDMEAIARLARVHDDPLHVPYNELRALAVRIDEAGSPEELLAIADDMRRLAPSARVEARNSIEALGMSKPTITSPEVWRGLWASNTATSLERGADELERHVNLLGRRDGIKRTFEGARSHLRSIVHASAENLRNGIAGRPHDGNTVRQDTVPHEWLAQARVRLAQGLDLQ